MNRGALPDRLEERLWPRLEAFVESCDVAGLAVAVVQDQEVAARGFGVRDTRTGEPVTPDAMFHLASVSKPFVATAVGSLAVQGEIDLDAAITTWMPELALADGRQAEVTARGLLSHTSGLGDVTDYGWHDPQMGDDALSEFVSGLAAWRLESEPGTRHSYSNAGYELLGLLVSRVMGTTFEEAVEELVLAPRGMVQSTFLRADVPAALVTRPHVGLPLVVPGDAYPYTRRHAPSSTLHSNLVELCRWMQAHLEPPALDPGLLDLMWAPVIELGDPPWDEWEGLGWALGSYDGERMVGHSGTDPGFGSRVALVPERRTGVVVLANSNTVPASLLVKAALDVALDPSGPGEGSDALRGWRRPVAGPVAEALEASGVAAARAEYHRLTATDPSEHDLIDDGFEDAVWGAIELHRTDLVWPLLRLWAQLRPHASTVWTMTGWAHHVDQDPSQARAALRHALELDPDDGHAAQVLAGLSR